MSACLRQQRNGNAALTFRRDFRGRTFLSEQFASYPFHITKPFYVDTNLPGMATLYLQSASGGLFQGDELRLSITVENQAQAHVTTQASTKAHSMEHGHASQCTHIVVGNDATLEMIADPLILFPNSRVYAQTKIILHPGATAIVGDCFLMHDPNAGKTAFDYLSNETVFESETGKPLVIDRIRLDGTTAQAALPGITGAVTAHGNLFVASKNIAAAALAEQLHNAVSEIDGVFAGASTLPNGVGAVARIAADNAVTLRQALHAGWCAARFALTGMAPGARRK